ncbi:MAG: GNAT family N-acetyltransferase [Acetobacteraceae bacterium]|nr:GNAT family N-acetyltransferase [Acetobacteraceae bacterium]
MLPLLTTPRLVLRPAVAADIDAVWQMLVLPEVRRYLCDDIALPRATVAGIVGEAAFGAGLGLWVAERAGAFAGIAALKPVPPALVALVPALAGEIEPTVALLPALWRQGLAGEMLGAVLAHGFATLALPRIAAVCDVPNIASAAMLARAGFVPTGEHQGIAHRIRTWTLSR